MAELNRHTSLVHGDERPFQCQVDGCPKKFKLKHQLLRHALKHQNQKTLIQVQDAVENTTWVRIFPGMRLRKFLIAYCEGKGLNYQATQFTFDGRRVTATNSLASLGVEEGNTIGGFPGAVWGNCLWLVSQF